MNKSWKKIISLQNVTDCRHFLKEVWLKLDHVYGAKFEQRDNKELQSRVFCEQKCQWRILLHKKESNSGIIRKKKELTGWICSNSLNQEGTGWGHASCGDVSDGDSKRSSVDHST